MALGKMELGKLSCNQKKAVIAYQTYFETIFQPDFILVFVF